MDHTTTAAVLPAGCSKQGWLIHKDLSSMRKWFELWGETLYAFDLPNRFSRTCTTVRHDRTLAYLGDCLASKLLYSIDLGSIIITENTAVRPDAFIFSSKLCLEISKPMVSYFLCAADEKDKESWLDAIGEAIQRKKGVLFSVDLISFCLFVCLLFVSLHCFYLYIACSRYKSKGSHLENGLFACT